MATCEMGAFLGPDLDLGVQIRWALQLARARSLDLLVIIRVDGSDNAVADVGLTDAADGYAGVVAAQLLRLVESEPGLRVGPRDADGGDQADGDDESIYMRLKKITTSDPVTARKLLLSVAAGSKLKLVTRAGAELAKPDPELARERQLFLRYAPCEVVMCFGLREDVALDRILVAVASGPHGAAAMRLGSDLARRSGGEVTAVRVNPSVGPDAEDVGELRLNARLRKALGPDVAGIRHRIVIDDQIDRGIRRVWEEGGHDLIVLGAPRAGMQGGRVGAGIPARVFKGDPLPVMAVISAPSPMRNRAVGFLEGAVERIVPQIEREDRITLVDRIQSSSRWDFDFFLLMALSTTIAAIGLIQNSAAVVIGAMLVAPLMTPLLGLGLALVQGNPVLARISGRAILLGLAVALAVGIAVGLMTPGFSEPTREMLGRGEPGPLDLVVAFASGLAAAYASARPGLLAALPGVAIAAALVPPVATCGLAVSLHNIDLAANALLLFVINMFLIVLASMISLWSVGLRDIRRIARWRVALGGTVLVASLVLAVTLAFRDRASPLSAGPPPELAAEIERELGATHRLAELTVAYDELGVQLNVHVVGATVASPELVDRIRAVVRDQFRRPVRVRLQTRLEQATDGVPARETAGTRP